MKNQQAIVQLKVDLAMYEKPVVAENYHPLEIPLEYIECYESARMFKVGEAQFAGIRKMPVK